MNYELILRNVAKHIQLDDTEVLQITKPNLDLLYERVPKFERFFILMIGLCIVSLINGGGRYSTDNVILK